MPEIQPAIDQEDISVDPGDMNRPATASESKFAIARKLITNIKEELSNLERLLAGDADSAEVEDLIIHRETSEGDLIGPANEGKIVEGVFDGNT